MKLKGKMLKLFKEIEHGDEEHRKWLYDKMLDFQNRKNTKCEHRNIKEHLCMPRYDECLDCGKTWGS